MNLDEAKRLTQQAASHTGGTCQGVIDLTLAVNILIGLVEGHRHTCGTEVVGEQGGYPVMGIKLTGPMQAMEDRA